MSSRAPDGHADADLARPLGDADEHDVHDADAADEQRHGGDAAEQHVVIILEVCVAICITSSCVRTVKSGSALLCRSRIRVVMSFCTCAMVSLLAACTMMEFTNRRLVMRFMWLV